MWIGALELWWGPNKCTKPSWRGGLTVVPNKTLVQFVWGVKMTWPLSNPNKKSICFLDLTSSRCHALRKKNERLKLGFWGKSITAIFKEKHFKTCSCSLLNALRRCSWYPFPKKIKFPWLFTFTLAFLPPLPHIFLSNNWTTLSHTWFYLEILIRSQKMWKRTSPNKKIYIVFWSRPKQVK